MDTSYPDFSDTKQTLVRLNAAKASHKFSNGEWINTFEKPACVLQDGDIVELQSGSIDTSQSSVTETVVLDTDTDIDFTFVAGLQHAQDDVAQTVFYNPSNTTFYDKDDPANTSVTYLNNVPNGGEAYPIETTLKDEQGSGKLYQIAFAIFSFGGSGQTPQKPKRMEINHKQFIHNTSTEIYYRNGTGYGWKAIQDSKRNALHTFGTTTMTVQWDLNSNTYPGQQSKGSFQIPCAFETSATIDQHGRVPDLKDLYSGVTASSARLAAINNFRDPTKLAAFDSKLPILTEQQIKSLKLMNFEDYKHYQSGNTKLDGVRHPLHGIPMASGTNYNISLQKDTNGALHVVSAEDFYKTYYPQNQTSGENIELTVQNVKGVTTMLVYKEVASSLDKIIHSTMKTHTKTVHFEKGTYEKSEFLQLLSDKLSDYETSVDTSGGTATYNSSSFLQSTSSLSDAADIPVYNQATGQIELQSSSEHGGLFFHPAYGSFYQTNPATGKTTEGREYAFARRKHALRPDPTGNGRYSEALDPIVYGASRIAIESLDNSYRMQMHTPWYDTTALKSEQSSGDAVVGFTRHTNGCFRREYESAIQDVVTFPADGTNEFRTGYILPTLMKVTRYGWAALKEVKAYDPDTGATSDIFSRQLGINWQEHYISTEQRLTRFPGLPNSDPHEWLVEVPQKLTTGKFTSSQLDVIDNSISKLNSSIAKPFYYSKLSRGANIRNTASTSFIDPGDKITIQGVDYYVQLQTQSPFSLFDLELEAKTASLDVDAILIDNKTDNPIVGSTRTASYDLALDFFPAQSSNMPSMPYSSLKICGVVPNYYSEDGFISASSSNGLVAQYKGPLLPLTSVKVSIVNSETEEVETTLGPRSVFTWLVKQPLRIPKSLSSNWQTVDESGKPVPAKRAKYM